MENSRNYFLHVSYNFGEELFEVLEGPRCVSLKIF